MRERMILDLPREVQMAIKLRAIKDRCTTGAIVEWCVRDCFPKEVEEARQVLEELAKGGDVH